MHRTGYWLLARFGIFGKTALGRHRHRHRHKQERRGRCSPLYRSCPALSLSLSLAPASRRSQPIQHPTWEGALWATSSTLGRPARVRGLVLKRTAMGNFFVFSFCAKPRTGKCCRGQATKRLCHQDHATPAQAYIYSSYSHIVSIPPPHLLVVQEPRAGGLVNIAPRSVVSRVWAAVLVLWTPRIQLCKLSQRT